MAKKTLKKQSQIEDEARTIQAPWIIMALRPPEFPRAIDSAALKQRLSGQTVTNFAQPDDISRLLLTQ